MADAGGKLGSTTYWYVVLFWFGSGFGFGIEFTCTWIEMIVFACGFIGSIEIPLAGFTLGVVFPFTVTLVGLNAVPFGIT
ncbi:cell surface protein, partial [Bacillus sp. MB366]